MKDFNPENERLKHRYFAYQRGAHGHSEASIKHTSAALHAFEVSTRFKSFKAFDYRQAMAFRRKLAETRKGDGKGALSLATQRSMLAALKAFFLWLAAQPGFKSEITYSDVAYFSLGRKDNAVATRRLERSFPSLDQIHHVIRRMPHNTLAERRDRALLACAALTGARDGALSSAQLRHVDLEARTFLNDGATMRTKFAKTYVTTFFPVGGEAEAILADWVNFLRNELHFGDCDPLFPPTDVTVNPATGLFEASGLKRTIWQSAGPVRLAFRQAFTAAGLPYYNPHSIRSTLTQLGQRICKTPEEMKAWSQNLGHAKLETTMMSYGEVRADRQTDIIKSLGKPRPSESSSAFDVEAVAEAVAAKLRRA